MNTQFQFRLLTYRRASRFIEQLSQLAERGIDTNGAVLVQPMALAKLTELAKHANQYMTAVGKFEELAGLHGIEKTLHEIADMQLAVEDPTAKDGRSNLVLGQCPECYAINRHEPNCSRSPCSP